MTRGSGATTRLSEERAAKRPKMVAKGQVEDVVFASAPQEYINALKGSVKQMADGAAARAVTVATQIKSTEIKNVVVVHKHHCPGPAADKAFDTKQLDNQYSK